MTTPTLNPQARFSKDVGKAICFIGNECEHWSLNDFVSAARRLRALGFDSMAPKKSDGTIKFYSGPGQIVTEYHAVTGEGVGYIPVGYSYGPRFGLGFVNQECDVFLEMTQAIANARNGEGFVIADMEVEYDNRPDACERFTHCMLGKSGLLGVTTWADPVQQGWDANIKALLPCVNAWIPQQYNSWLGSQTAQLLHDGAINIEPAVDLSQEFGANNQTLLIRQAKARGETGIWFWDYSLTGNAQLVRNLTTLARNF